MSRKALVIDDDRTVRAILRRTLQEFDMDVVEAENGRQGLALLAAEQPDLVVLDLVMPELGGQGVLQAIRSRPEYQGLPIVCCSSVDDREQILHLAGQGIMDYLLKPLHPKDTYERLADIVARIDHQVAPPSATATRTKLLFVHPDPAFLAVAVPILQQDYEVVVAKSGHEAEQEFSRRLAEPTIICIGERLGLRGEDELVPILRAIAREHGRDTPAVYLIANGRTVDQDKAQRYHGVLHRTLVTGDFEGEVRRVIGAASSGQV